MHLSIITLAALSSSLRNPFSVLVLVLLQPAFVLLGLASELKDIEQAKAMAD